MKIQLQRNSKKITRKKSLRKKSVGSKSQNKKASLSRQSLKVDHNALRLTEAITEFVREGLAGDEAIVIIAISPHWTAIKKSLKESNKRFDRTLLGTQIRYYNAEKILKKILKQKKQPHALLFDEWIESIYNPLSSDYGRVRFYAEIVNLLCAEGEIEAAKAQEANWNHFLASHLNSFLLCGYNLRRIYKNSPRKNLGTARSSQLPLEPVIELLEENKLYRKIALLENEIALVGMDPPRKIIELKATKARLLQLGKLSIAGEICAGIAHEINNPLAIVSGYLDQLRRSIGAQFSEVHEKKITKIQNATDRMARIVANVLRFSGQDQIKKEMISIQIPIHNAVELAQDMLQSSHIAVKMILPFHELLCWGDEEILTHVFFNLISNSADAILAKRQMAGMIEIHVWVDNKDSIEIRISDNGIGMDQKTQNQVFFPFFTKKLMGKGTGLGLSISHTQIKAHGGRITCTSTLGKGSSFTVKLPIGEHSAKIT